MSETTYRNRKAVQIENGGVRLTVLVEGGHIAEILDKRSGINPLWTPNWPSIEPSSYDPAKHTEYGEGSESKLLGGIMGHNLCLDLFGGPAEDEVAAGWTVHGEASVVPYEIESHADALTVEAALPLAGLHFKRELRLVESTVQITETVDNLLSFGRPLAWTQHVTLGPPFLDRGKTQFRLTATSSRTYEEEFGDTYAAAANFEWPMAPRPDGTTSDLQIYTAAPVAAGYTAHKMDPSRQDAAFLAWSPAHKLLFGYRWRRQDFPWLGMWIENCYRPGPPWNGNTITCGLEFGASPMAEPRQRMVERGSLFGVPAFRWLPAKARITAQYSAFLQSAESIPDAL